MEERLHARIFSIMRRIIDPESHDFDIVHKEMANPTGLLAGSIQELIDPILGGIHGRHPRYPGRTRDGKGCPAVPHEHKVPVFRSSPPAAQANAGPRGPAISRSRLHHAGRGNARRSRHLFQPGGNPRSAGPESKKEELRDGKGFPRGIPLMSRGAS